VAFFSLQICSFSPFKSALFLSEDSGEFYYITFPIYFFYGKVIY